MQNKKAKILVLFVEPMLYIMDLIKNVYEKTPYEFQYVFCYDKLTGKDNLCLPKEAVVCQGKPAERKKQIQAVFKEFSPSLAVINGYVGLEQETAIRWCQAHNVPYAIETDTPLHIPKSPIKAALKKLYLRTLLKNKLCYGFPGGTPQKKNLVYYGIPEERCHIMPMCVSTDRLRAQAGTLPDKDTLKAKHGLAGKNVFLFVGRLEKVKNIPVLLEAFSQLKKEDPNVALMIVGDGSETAALKELAAGIEDVYFAGYVVFPELVEYYKLADVLVLPSSYESWGLVINEAQALGLPVVVSSCVGCGKDLIIAGNNGYIFSDDNAEELTRAMEKSLLLDQPDVYMADQWNHEKYYQNFLIAVKHIC